MVRAQWHRFNRTPKGTHHNFRQVRFRSSRLVMGSCSFSLSELSIRSSNLSKLSNNKSNLLYISSPSRLVSSLPLLPFERDVHRVETFSDLRRFHQVVQAVWGHHVLGKLVSTVLLLEIWRLDLNERWRDLASVALVWVFLRLRRL